jgi:hypothetical protein
VHFDNSRAVGDYNFCLDNSSRGSGFRCDRQFANRIETVPGLAGPGVAQKAKAARRRPYCWFLKIPDLA